MGKKIGDIRLWLRRAQDHHRGSWSSPRRRGECRVVCAPLLLAIELSTQRCLAKKEERWGGGRAVGMEGLVNRPGFVAFMERMDSYSIRYRDLCLAVWRRCTGLSFLSLFQSIHLQRNHRSSPLSFSSSTYNSLFIRYPVILQLQTRGSSYNWTRTANSRSGSNRK